MTYSLSVYENHKRYVANRKKLGLCVSCNRKTAKGRILCLEHQEKKNKKHNEWRAKRKLGLG